MYIEKPTSNQTYTRPDITGITVEGWAVSSDSNAELQVFIDGNKVNSTITRISRGDVDTAVSSSYGGTAMTSKAGFQATVDISYLGKGKHTIKIQELSRYGELICETSTIINIENKKYSGKMYIENPTSNRTYTRPDNTKVTVEGWAVSSDSNAGLQVFIDGNKVNSTITRISRGDVDKAVSGSYGGTVMTPKAGFQVILDINNLVKGNHTIKVKELSRYGELICESSTSINVENKKYSRKNVYRKANSKSNIYKTR